MIRLLHAADIHIGMENYGRLNPDTGINTRIEDFCNTLDEMVDRAIEDEIDLVVFAGDIYKTREPKPIHQAAFAARIRRLTQAGIPVFITPGNHDLPLAEGKASSVEIFRALEVEGVTLGTEIGGYRIATKAGPCQILSLPWVTRSSILSRGEYKNRTILELNEIMVNLALGQVHAAAERLDPTIPTILVSHIHAFGATVGAERLLAMGADPVYSVLDLAAIPNVDYVALGHIHKHQALQASNPPVVYSGSINRVDFSEELEEKGYVLAEVERGSCRWTFVPVAARPFITIDADLDEEDPNARVFQSIFPYEERLPEAVVRLRLKGTRAAFSYLDDGEVDRQLRTAFFTCKIQRTYTDEPRTSVLSEARQHLTPEQLLAAYFSKMGYSAERTTQLMGAAKEFMDSEAPIL